MNKFFPLLILFAAATAEVLDNTPSKPALTLGGPKSDAPAARKLNMQATNMNTGFYLQQLLQTHQVSNEGQLQTQRQDELRGFENSFQTMEDKIDEFRDGVSQKLQELKAALERPHVPILGMGNMMNHPYTGQYATSTLAKAHETSVAAAKAASFSGAPSFQSLQNNFKTSLESVANAAESLKSMSNPTLAVQKGLATVAASQGTANGSLGTNAGTATNANLANLPVTAMTADPTFAARRLKQRTKPVKKNSIL
jgi:hypothetical protein